MPISKQTLLARLSGFPISSTQTAIIKSALADFPYSHWRSDEHATFNGHRTPPLSTQSIQGHRNLDAARVPTKPPSNCKFFRQTIAPPDNQLRRCIIRRTDPHPAIPLQRTVA